MTRTTICPHCNHVVDTYVRPQEGTWCEACGEPLRLPEDAPSTERVPPRAVIRRRGELAGLTALSYAPGGPMPYGR